jgi:hypothetical protein
MQDFNSILQINSEQLLHVNSDDVKLWGGIYNYLAPNKTLVDRSGTISMPFNIVVYDDFKLPTLNYNFNKTFEDICLETAQRILNHQDTISKPIYLFYSGGIDSVTVLVSFLKLLSLKEAADRISIIMTSDSIVEYPKMYNEIIRPNFHILSSDNVENFFDRRAILLTGGQGDKIFGTDNIGKIYRQGNFDQLGMAFSEKFITSFWVSVGIPVNSAKVWFRLLDEQIKNCGVYVYSNYDFLWWFNFLLEWQSEYFLFSLRSRHPLNFDYYQNYMFAFFNTIDHQLWSINNLDKKIKNTWSSYKFIAKNFIYSYNQDAGYRDNKIKGPSLNRLFHSRKTPMGIDCNFNMFESIKIRSIYNDKNSFS